MKRLKFDNHQISRMTFYPFSKMLMKSNLKVKIVYNPLGRHRESYAWEVRSFDSIEEFKKIDWSFVKSRDTMNILFYTKKIEVERWGLTGS